MKILSWLDCKSWYYVFECDGDWVICILNNLIGCFLLCYVLELWESDSFEMYWYYRNR